jgi:hypothetical protein
MPRHASELAHRLALNAEAVCRHYLSNGRREGRYWLVGDVANNPGRSLFVRMTGPTSGKGAAGKWTDSATLQHGDLLDLIALNRGLDRLRDTLDEARSFLRMPLPDPSPDLRRGRSVPHGSPESARRLYAMSQPIADTIAEAHLRNRGITVLLKTDPLRFHPQCYYRPGIGGPTETWPALIAAVTDLGGRITGAHRTWLNPNGFDPVHLGKAPIDTPRRAMGELLGNAVRFGLADDVLTAGEGIETILSPRSIMPTMPSAAALSANHLAALLLPTTLRRLYIARDNDPAGYAAAESLAQRANEAGIEAITLSPTLGDFNEDLRRLGAEHLRARLRTQLIPQDVARFIDGPTAWSG